MNRIASLVRTVTTGLVLSLFAASVLDAEPAKAPKIKLDTLKPGKVQLDPRLGYILVRVGPKSTPTDRPIAVAFARIDEKTDRWFLFANPKDMLPDFWRTMVVGVNTGRSFADVDGHGTYLVSAFPGRWVIGGVGTTCFPLGTYSFDVKQGEVVDIGTLLTAREDGKSSAPQLKDAKLSQDLVDFGVAMNIVMSNTFYVLPAMDEPALPTEMASMPRHKVELNADFRYGNLCADMINRAASLPPLGHQPPMTVAQAVEAIGTINPADIVERKAKRLKAEATKAAAAASH
ncbi:MAG: hypothetical protein ABJA20_11425 [Novosphingobium sp.]